MINIFLEIQPYSSVRALGGCDFFIMFLANAEVIWVNQVTLI